MKKFSAYRQLDKMDCGPTCLRMISKYYGKSFSLEQLRQLTNISTEGVSTLGISEAAEAIGFKAFIGRVSFEQLDEEVPLPCILHWKESHFVVLPPQDYSTKNKNAKITVADPDFGMVSVDRDTFLKCWLKRNDTKGLVVVLEPTDAFFEQKESKDKGGKDLSVLLKYLKPYRKYILQLFLALLLGSVFSLIFPFLTQALVDYGVNHQNLGFIQLILISQLALTLGAAALEIIRSRILVHINSRVNITMISDFLLKLMKLPLKFFESRMLGDILQRIADHSRIDHFLTNGLFNTMFSMITLLVFSMILWYYQAEIAVIFLAGSLLSVAWISVFLKYRKNLDYKYFTEQSQSQNSVNELVMGIRDIKIHNSEIEKRWGWERIQVAMFKLRLKTLTLENYQKIGNTFFIQVKNVVISYYAATEVVNGNISLGMMLSISYIIGQMNSPVEQLLSFIRSAQDARISLERVNEVHQRDNEEDQLATLSTYPRHENRIKMGGDIVFQDVSFQYGGKTSPVVLRNCSFTIAKGKVTAIVGMSGCGKTTILKLLLRFYDSHSGAISLDAINLQSLSPKQWRNQCGVVFQDSFIFSDSIAGNIAMTHEDVDYEKLSKAARIANLEEFILELPRGYDTKVGNSGSGLSAGQRLRLLIARAVYKDPQFIFFDEATSVLDAHNERIIMENLENFFVGRTVVLVAHRLSTVKNADQIIVMEKGEIVEIGKHDDLLQNKGKYYQLVKNQL